MRTQNYNLFHIASKDFESFRNISIYLNEILLKSPFKMYAPGKILKFPLIKKIPVGNSDYRLLFKGSSPKNHLVLANGLNMLNFAVSIHNK